MSYKLDGKISIITGGSSGIGKAIVKKYLEAGSKVVIADINEAAMSQSLQELNQQYPNMATTIKMDVSDEKSVNDAFDKIMETYPKIDILVSNAGIQHLSPICEFDYTDWQKILKVNLDGCFLTSKRAMQEMKKTGGGTILFTGSIRSKIGGKLDSAYVAAKHGLLGLTEVVATEGAEFNIRSNIICPGYILTDMVEKQISRYMAERNLSRDEVIKNILLPETVDGKFTDINDVAEMALVFAGFPSNALTGQSILITHGWQMD